MKARIAVYAPPTFWTALLTSIIVTLAGCGDEETPEDRVRGYIDRVIESAEARNWRSFRDYVADDYKDEHGMNKEAVLAIVARYILANQRIYILERVASVRIENPRNAHAVVYAAMGGQPISGAQDLARIRADVYRFEIDLRAGDDGVFRARRSVWKPVGPEHFLLGH
jgi:hypothetical protein